MISPHTRRHWDTATVRPPLTHWQLPLTLKTSDESPHSRAHPIRRNRGRNYFHWSVPVYLSREHLSEPLGERSFPFSLLPNRIQLTRL